jgi:hypothetical protein
MTTKRTASIYPTAEEINALPEKFRRYIHDLETRCDKSGDVQTMALLREDREALLREVEELKMRQSQSQRGARFSALKTRDVRRAKLRPSNRPSGTR